MTTTTATAALSKPRVRTEGPDAFRIDFGNGKTALMIKPANLPSYDQSAVWMAIGDDVAMRYHDEQAAFVAASIKCGAAPAPIATARETVAAEIAKACAVGATEVTKLMRKYLKMRTGYAWSVTNGRGTGYGWIRIESAPARRTKPFDYMPTSDRVVLGAILGEDPGAQGTQVRTEAGVREWYLWKLSGHEVPADLKVSERSWD